MPPIRGNFQNSAARQNRRRPGFALAFSAPVIAACCLLLICSVAWAFFMGFMVGRGQNPEARVQDLTGILKAEEKAPEAPVEPESANAEKTETEEPPPAQIAAAPPAPEPQPFVRPKGEELAAWGEKPAQNPVAQTPPKTANTTRPGSEKSSAKAGNAARAKPTQPAAKTPPAPVFDYTFQTAAYKNNTDAARLCANLKKAGYNAVSRKSGKVYLVLVNLRGTEADAAALRETLLELKLGKPLQLAKKARNAPQKAGGKN